MMLKVIIIDDEQNAVITLQSFISKYLNDVQVVGVAHSKKEAIALVNSIDFNLILLDINLGDGKGFEVLEAIDNKDFGVIFTTAYDQYAIKAFKYSAIDYLLKPINPDDFINAVERYKKYSQNFTKQQLNIANDYVNNLKHNKLVINSINEIHFIDIDDILRLESDKNYTDVFLVNKQKITSSKTLKFYEELLPENNFLRIHQKHIVNIRYISKYLKEDGGYIVLTEGSKIEVSRRKKDNLMSSLFK